MAEILPIRRKNSTQLTNQISFNKVRPLSTLSHRCCENRGLALVRLCSTEAFYDYSVACLSLLHVT